MAQWPKLIYKKDNPEHVERVNKIAYYRHIHRGWGGVTSSKISKRLQLIMDSFELDRDQMWEFMNLRIDELPVARDQFDCIMRGHQEHDSRVTPAFLMVIATITSQPLAWFTKDQPTAVIKPWRHWDFGKTTEKARKLSFFQISYKSERGMGSLLLTAYDKPHARGIIASKYPDIHILSVVEIPATPGIEIR